MFADQGEGGTRAYLGDGLEIVTAEEDAKVNELEWLNDGISNLDKYFMWNGLWVRI